MERREGTHSSARAVGYGLDNDLLHKALVYAKRAGNYNLEGFSNQELVDFVRSWDEYLEMGGNQAPETVSKMTVTKQENLSLQLLEEIQDFLKTLHVLSETDQLAALEVMNLMLMAVVTAKGLIDTHTNLNKDLTNHNLQLIDQNYKLMSYAVGHSWTDIPAQA